MRFLITATPDVMIVDAAHLMAEHRIRHLPVVEGENLVGMAESGTCCAPSWSASGATTIQGHARQRASSCVAAPDLHRCPLFQGHRNQPSTQYGS